MTRNSARSEVRSTTTSTAVSAPGTLVATRTTGGLLLFVAATVAVLAMVTMPVVGVALAVTPSVCLAVLATALHRRKRSSYRSEGGS